MTREELADLPEEAFAKLRASVEQEGLERDAYERGWSLRAWGADSMTGAYLTLAMVDEDDIILARTTVSGEDMRHKWGFDWEALGGSWEIERFQHTVLSAGLAHNALRYQEKREAEGQRSPGRLRQAWAALVGKT